MKSEFKIRLASPADQADLIDFNQAMAWETEAKHLVRETLAKGIAAVLKNPEYGFYLVGEQQGQVAGGLLVTKEWSDWRNGMFWWIQSVYVRPLFRRQGLYRQLYTYVKRLTIEQGGVCGLRLYVEKDNDNARKTYQSLGMHETHYRMYEEQLV
jgi:ribosomal protein S18 acetylase RimI-like enzyme